MVKRMEKFVKDNYEIYDHKKQYERKIMTNFHREVNDSDKEETVRYLPETTALVWFNIESLDYPLHWHPDIEIVFNLEEEYKIECTQEVFVLKPYDILVIPAGELHHVCEREGGSRLFYLFDYDRIANVGGFSYLRPYLSHPFVINQENASAIYRKERTILEDIFVEYSHENAMWETIAYSKLIDFLATYGRFKAPSKEEIASLQSYKQKDIVERINKVYDYLDANYMEDVSLEKAADIAGFSKFHFSRLFKEFTGQNFYDYLCYKRIQATEKLLINSDLSITDIAYKCGFSSPSTYNRTFKRIKGCTPSEYRSLLNKSYEPETPQYFIDLCNKGIIP